MKKNTITEEKLELQMEDGVFTTCTCLRVEQPKYVMIFSHAFGGKAEQYRRMFYALSQVIPISIYCMDLRGGDPQNGNIYHVDDPQTLSCDMEQLYTYVRNIYPHIPLYFCAHSGSSALALKLVTSRVGVDIAGLFLIEPVFPGDFEIYYENSSWLYKAIHYSPQKKVVKALQQPKIENKWTYKFSVINYILSSLHSIFNKFILLKVRSEKGGDWDNYTSNYIKGYSTSYTDFELKQRLGQLHCPLWVAAGENDEYTYIDGLVSTIKWHVPPNKIRDIKLLKGVSHFGTLSVASSLIARWLKLEETS